MRSLSSLSYIIQESLFGISVWRYSLGYTNDYKKESSYMIVPLFTDSFEVPAFALQAFNNLCNLSDSTYDDITSHDALCIHLETKGNISTYATLDSNIRNTFQKDYIRNKLIPVKAKNTNTTYYITNGAIFNSDYIPIVMLSWILQKIQPDDSDAKYQFVRPILRVSPDIYVNKADEVQRYIINKIMQEALKKTNIQCPHINNRMFSLDGLPDYYTIKVVLDNSPFVIRQTDLPSVSTTNKELLDVALNNIDELIQ